MGYGLNLILIFNISLHGFFLMVGLSKQPASGRADAVDYEPVAQPTQRIDWTGEAGCHAAALPSGLATASNKPQDPKRSSRRQGEGLKRSVCLHGELQLMKRHKQSSLLARPTVWVNKAIINNFLGTQIRQILKWNKACGLFFQIPYFFLSIKLKVRKAKYYYHLFFLYNVFSFYSFGFLIELQIIQWYPDLKHCIYHNCCLTM